MPLILFSFRALHPREASCGTGFSPCALALLPLDARPSPGWASSRAPCSLYERGIFLLECGGSTPLCFPVLPFVGAGLAPPAPRACAAFRISGCRGFSLDIKRSQRFLPFVYPACPDAGRARCFLWHRLQPVCLCAIAPRRGAQPRMGLFACPMLAL